MDSQISLFRMIHAYKKNKKSYFIAQSNSNSIIQYDEPKPQDSLPTRKMKTKCQSTEQLSLKGILDNWQYKQKLKQEIMDQNIQRNMIEEGPKRQKQVSPIQYYSEQRNHYFLKKQLRIDQYSLQREKLASKRQQLITQASPQVYQVNTTHRQHPQKGIQFKKTDRNFDWQKLNYHESSLPFIRSPEPEKKYTPQLNLQVHNVQIPVMNAFDIKLADFDEADIRNLNQQLFDARTKVRQLGQSINRLPDIHMQRLNKLE